MSRRHQTFVCRKAENTDLMKCICGRCEAEQLRAENSRLKAELEAALQLDSKRRTAYVAELQAERDEAQRRASELALKFGGVNAGHAYGPANCAACKSLSNDYYLIGQSRLCLECFDEFPSCLSQSEADRDALKEQLAKATEALAGLIGLCHHAADFRNGNTHEGRDEGQVRAMEMLERYEKLLAEIGGTKKP